MTQHTKSTPSYRLHRPTNKAVVTLNGRDFYLGPYGSPGSRAEYNRLVGEWLSRGRNLPVSPPRPAHNPANPGSDLTVNELALAFLRHAQTYYRKGGQPTSEAGNIKCALRPLIQLYGHTPAAQFGPLALKVVRDRLGSSGLTRSGVNRGTRLIVRAFRWAAENELVPVTVHQSLKTVPGLRRGRTDLPEARRVKPVSLADVEAIQPYVSPQVWAMIQIQLKAAMRPGEVCIMRTVDIVKASDKWIYTPGSHKTEHHEKERPIPLGPQAMAVVEQWLRPEPTAYLFSPAEAETQRKEDMRQNRKTRVQPSQANRAKSRPRKSPGAVYTVDSYRRAIQYGILRANRENAKHGKPAIPAWHPNQLRHSTATMLRREFGLDVARAVLGHSSPAVTQIYAEVDMEKAAEAMSRVG